MPPLDARGSLTVNMTTVVLIVAALFAAGILAAVLLVQFLTLD
jgi:hypothetical protein